MRGRTICVLADAAAMPMQSYLKHFRGNLIEKASGDKADARKRNYRDEYTLTAKRSTHEHGAPDVLDVGMGMDRV
jgi:hypothetical protein